MDLESCVPPGFRFHPTEEELVGYYLNRKINCLKIDLDVITEIDLYRIEPWDIQDSCKLGYEEQNEWYFFSHKDRKYPTGTRTNRATAAGFWKATGRDKAVISKEKIIGMRKTLVFYKGRAPNGRKSDWIMHEYRLQASEHGPPQEEGWVVCRAFKKPSPSHKQGFEAWTNAYYINRENPNFRPPFFPGKSSSSILTAANLDNEGTNFQQVSFPRDHQEEHIIISNQNIYVENHLNIELPQLDHDSPSISTSLVTKEGFDHNSLATSEDLDQDEKSNNYYNDWKIFDKFMVPQVLDQPSSYVSQNHDEMLFGCFSEL